MYGVTNTLVFSLCASFILNTEKIPSGPAGVIGFAFVLVAAMQAGIGTLLVAIFYNTASAVHLANFTTFIKSSVARDALHLVNDLR